ncbi:MAG TPA: hypothetical protein VLA92_01130 [Candidatus Saccharimonadales bacterium]|nr:hypothetical protein [Candidatus Saccharimonadales bacterium]
MSPEKKTALDHLRSLRRHVGAAVGRLIAPQPDDVALGQRSPEQCQPNVGEFYAAYVEFRDRYVAGYNAGGVNLAQDLDRAAYICMLAVTEAMYSFDRHNIPYNYGGGFVYPEVKTRRMAEPEDYYATEVTHLSPDTRELALEFTQAWIIHGSSPDADNTSLHRSFEHLGCSLTSDCLTSGITFEDLGIRPTPEIEHSTPSNVMAMLRFDLDTYPDTPIIQDVRDAFALRVDAW